MVIAGTIACGLERVLTRIIAKVQTITWAYLNVRGLTTGIAFGTESYPFKNKSRTRSARICHTDTAAGVFQLDTFYPHLRIQLVISWPNKPSSQRFILNLTSLGGDYHVSYANYSFSYRPLDMHKMPSQDGNLGTNFISTLPLFAGSIHCRSLLDA
jgi:hypothetical protein